MHAKGHNGQVTFDGQFATITRTGLIARATVGKGDKRLHISQLASVQWKPADLMAFGFIQFGMPGGNERRSAFGRQSIDANRDENSVTFTKAQQPAFEQLRAALDHGIAMQHQTPPPQYQQAPPQPQYPQQPWQQPTTPPAQTLPPLDHRLVADELAKLAALVQQGVLTQQEFEVQKAKLLGR
ncbi:DUF4429 domain-containing protein [Streptomyces sp. NPDC058067]|uniref:DUF4429 domain-containing protein n=1 Tax=Streptomyces sp. NPDC058067 TaxID=3346324 RepID=UPI0036E052EF